jgi:uncharacterized membrane protein HdeD (DUF308 family)
MDLMARHWWLHLLRGIAAIAFGVLTVVMPGVTLTVLVLLFAMYAFAAGVLAVVVALRGAREHRRRWWAFLLEGIAGIAFAVLTVVWPTMTALVLVYFIASWAVITGVLQVTAAIRLRHEIRGEWLLLLAGLLSIGLGFAMFVFPAAGALALVLWIGAYALVYGTVTILLGLRLRSARSSVLPMTPGDRAAM